MSIQIVEIAQPSVIDTVAVAQPSTVAVVEIRQGPAGTGGGGSNSVTSATTSDGTANLSISNVTTATATVSGTLTASHIHGNLAGNVYAHVLAGEALLKGDPVYVSGFNNGTSTAEVSKADASNAAKMPAIGIMDANLAHNATGHMVITGTITDVNTAGYAINAELYVAVGGGMTATPPTARAQPVARVERVNANNGAIIVKVNGLSASDATPSTLVRRDATGAAEFVGLTATGGTTFGEESLIQFDALEYYYGAGAAAAHRTALGSGATGDPLFTAASASAARTTLELGTGNTAQFLRAGLGVAPSATIPLISQSSNMAVHAASFTNTGTGAFVSAFESNAPNLTAGQSVYFGVGRNPATNNQFSFGFEYAGNGSTSNKFNINAYGSAALFSVLASGSVGIGTTSPSAKVHVATTGASSITALRLDSGSGGYAGFQMYDGNVGNSWAVGHEFGATSNASLVFSYGAVGSETVKASISSTGIFNGAGLDVTGNTLRLRTARTPASATAAGNAGDICWDANYIYVCTATNTWKRTAISTWP